MKRDGDGVTYEVKPCVGTQVMIEYLNADKKFVK
jgi:hypothetical protein